MSGIIGVSPDMRSGVVGAWPKGHIVQTIWGTPNTAGGDTGVGNTGTWMTTNTSVAITPTTPNSLIEIHCEIGDYHINMGGNTGGYMIIKNDTSGAYVHGSYQAYYWASVDAEDGYFYSPSSIFCKEILTTNATQTYILHAKAQAGRFYWGNHSYGAGTENNSITMMAREVQQ